MSDGEGEKENVDGGRNGRRVGVFLAKFNPLTIYHERTIASALEVRKWEEERKIIKVEESSITFPSHPSSTEWCDR